MFRLNQKKFCLFAVAALSVALSGCADVNLRALVLAATPTQTATATPEPTATFTPRPTYTPSTTASPTTSPTATATETPTATASPTATETPTATASPTPADTATPAPPPPTATTTETPAPAIDFRIVSWRLWPLALNSGCAKGMHTIFITVLDVNGAPLDNVIVGDSWNNVETMTGSKGAGKAEIDLWTNTMEMVVKRDGATGQEYTSEVSFPFSSYMTTIPNEQMIQAGYCANDLECDWKRQNDSYYCGGHYSWEVIFQKSY